MSLPGKHTRSWRTAPGSRRAAATLLVIVASSLVAVAALLAPAMRRATGEGAVSVERTSYAVGYSAGAGLRDVARLPLDPFRQGLLDGLAGGESSTRVMSRAELFSRIRAVMKRLSDAELARVAERIDETQDH